MTISRKHVRCGFAAVFVISMAAGLASLAVADDASVTPKVTATGRYEHFRRVVIDIASDPQLVGRTVVIKEGRKTLASHLLAAAEKGAKTAVELPMPTENKPYKTMSVLVDGKQLATVSLPDLKLAKQRAMYDKRLIFDRYVFDVDEFPGCDFEEPGAVEDLIGRYKISVRYFDQKGVEVTTAKLPGRYGAEIEIVGENGDIHRRFVTLYRQAERIDWRKVDLKAKFTVPDGMGIESKLADMQSAAEDDYCRVQIITSLYESEDSAIFFSALHETSLEDTTDCSEQSARWWLQKRKQLGMVEHRYETLLPEGYADHPGDRYPLVIFLHGSGERGVDLSLVHFWGPRKYLEAHPDMKCILVSPQCLPNQRWRACDVNDLLDEVITKYRVDADRVYLTGLSMGGYGTWTTAIEHPERFAAIAPICGGGDPKKAYRLKDVPTWVFHGAKDYVVPIRNDREMVDALKAASGDVRFTIYPETGHASWIEAYNTPEFYTWLFSQHRKNPSGK